MFLEDIQRGLCIRKMSFFYNIGFFLKPIFTTQFYYYLMDAFKFISPSAALAPFIRHYWILNIDELHVSERVAPIGCMQMVFHRGDRMYSLTENEIQPQTFIGGQSVGYLDLKSVGKVNMIVVVFQPHGIKPFFRMSMSNFLNRNISIVDIEDKSLSELEDRVLNASTDIRAIELIERFFLSRLYDFDSYNYKRMQEVLKVIDNKNQSSITVLSDVACLSYKQFSRVFTEYVGATPKEFTRIVRFQRALFMMQNNLSIDMMDVILTCGFYDQPHMIKEFKTFSGYTPNEYLATCQPYSDYFTRNF